ncbi:MAG: hypothetical protein KC656_04390, partial [Myxococcales bacterium]|nr:hypothetical protein [Myxococcales bacterium]
MADLHALIPDASAAWREIPALADVEADRLAACVLHPREPWWRRRCCAKALDGRVPTDSVDALEALVHDETLESELRGAVLLALASRPRDARRDRL